MEHITVIGAGPLGRATTRTLVETGHQVTVATRSGTQLPGAQAARADVVTGDGLHLPCIAAVGEENGVKMGIVQRRIARTNTIDLIAVGKGGLRRSSVVGKLFEHKLILRACKSLMAGHPLETKIERLCDSNPGILFRKVEDWRFLYIQIRPSRMPS